MGRDNVPGFGDDLDFDRLPHDDEAEQGAGTGVSAALDALERHAKQKPIPASVDAQEPVVEGLRYTLYLSKTLKPVYVEDCTGVEEGRHMIWFKRGPRTIVGYHERDVAKIEFPILLE